jgi:ABC-2 type transport system permease protein
MGWALGVMSTGFILRFGPKAEALAWAVPFVIQPVSAVFYPVSVLPQWLQYVAWMMPSAHAFEGMREVLSTGHLNVNHLWCAMVLNVLYLFLSGFVFELCLKGARTRGFLAKFGT